MALLEIAHDFERVDAEPIGDHENLRGDVMLSGCERIRELAVLIDFPLPADSLGESRLGSLAREALRLSGLRPTPDAHMPLLAFNIPPETPPTEFAWLGWESLRTVLRTRNHSTNLLVETSPTCYAVFSADFSRSVSFGQSRDRCKRSAVSRSWVSVARRSRSAMNLSNAAASVVNRWWFSLMDEPSVGTHQ